MARHQAAEGGRAGTAARRLPVAGAALFAAAVALVAALDSFGFPQPALLIGLLLLTLATFAWSGMAAGSTDPGQFGVAGRGVGATANGLGIAAETLSPAALLGVFGAVFAVGHDGLVYLVGLAGGLALAPLLLAAPMRSSGAVTVSELVALRYPGAMPRALAVIVLVVASLLIAAAQLTAVGHVGAHLAGVPYELAVAAGAGVVLVSACRGGIGAIARAQPLLWAIIAAALLLPLVIVTIDRPGLPLAQLGIGQTVSEVTRLEQALLRRALAEARSLKPLLTPFLTLDLLNLAGIALALTLGTAALPHMLAHAAAAPTARAARKSFVWGLLFFAIAASALPALAALTRLDILALIGKGTRLDALPQWIFSWGQLGVVKVCGVAAIDGQTIAAACRKLARHPGLLRLQDLTVDAELLLLAVPRITGLAFAVTALLAAGLLAAALAAIQAPLTAIAVSLAHDVWGGLVKPDTVGERRVAVARWLLPLVAAAAALIALARPADMLRLLVWGTSIAAAGLMPILVLGIWWRRANAAGAIAGLLVGSGICLAYILGTHFFAPRFLEVFAALSDVSPPAQRRFADLMQAWTNAAPGAAKAAAWTALDAHAQRIAGWWGLRPTAAALLAVPAGLITAIAVSLLTRPPSATVSADLAALRRPGSPPVLADRDGPMPDRR